MVVSLCYSVYEIRLKEELMKIIHEVTLDVSRQGVQCAIPITQHDAYVHRLIIHLRDGPELLKLSAHDKAELYVDTDTYEDVQIYLENSVYPDCLVYDISPFVSQESGEHRAILQIHNEVNGETFMYSPEFALHIKKDMTSSSKILSSPQYSAVLKALLAAEQYAKESEEFARLFKEGIAYYAETAETARHYTKGGEIDRKFRSLEENSAASISSTRRGKLLDIFLENSAGEIVDGETVDLFVENPVNHISYYKSGDSYVLRLSFQNGNAQDIDISAVMREINNRFQEIDSRLSALEQN